MTGTGLTDFQGYKALAFQQTVGFFQKYWAKALMLLLVLHILLNKDISIEFNLNAAGSQVYSASTEPEGGGAEQNLIPAAYKERSKKSNKLSPEIKKKAEKIGHLTLILSPGYARRHNLEEVIIQEKFRICNDYIEQFASIAKTEMRQYGVPASITLAQALLESNVGESRLALESNNHFGIKCRRKCKGCTCRNYADDDQYDMFRVFDSTWESYREHSKLLNSHRYRPLHKLKTTDYKGWARGLQRAGYATDKKYANKLIKIIETLNLERYDRQA